MERPVFHHRDEHGLLHAVPVIAAEPEEGIPPDQIDPAGYRRGPLSDHGRSGGTPHVRMKQAQEDQVSRDIEPYGNDQGEQRRDAVADGSRGGDENIIQHGDDEPGCNDAYIARRFVENIGRNIQDPRIGRMKTRQSRLIRTASAAPITSDDMKAMCTRSISFPPKCLAVVTANPFAAPMKNPM